MINDQEFLHGAAFLRLIDHGEQITIRHASWIHPSIYLIDTHSGKECGLNKVQKL